jgi:hypothetical protein
VIAQFKVKYIAAALPAAVRRCMHHNNRLFTLSGGFLGQASLTAAQLLHAIGSNSNSNSSNSSNSTNDTNNLVSSSTQLQLQRSSTRHSAAQALVTGRGAVSVTVSLKRLGDAPSKSDVAPLPPAVLTLQLLSVNGLAAAALQPAGVHYQCEAAWGLLGTAVTSNGSSNGYTAETHTLPCAVGSSVGSRVWRDETVCIPIAQLMASFVSSNSISNSTSTSTAAATAATVEDHSATCLRLRVHAVMLSAAARHRLASAQRQQQLQRAHCVTATAAAAVREYAELSRAVCSGTADKQCLAEVSLTADDVLQMLGGPVELPLLRVSSSAAARPTSKY